MHQDATWYEVGLSPGDFVLAGDSAPPKKEAELLPSFGPCLLRPNGRMDQDVTWYGGRPRFTRHCVRWDPGPPLLKGHSPQFSANIRCGQTAGWTRMPLGVEVGLGAGDCVRWGPDYPQKKGHTTPPNFWSMFIVAKRLDG